MIPLLAIIIFMMNFFSSLPDCGGGQVFFGGGRGAFPSPPQIGQPKADSQKPIADSW